MDLSDALRLIYIAGAEAAADGDRLDAVLGGGATALWLRAPDADGASLYRLARTCRQRTTAHGAALIVGDRVDVALAVKADGVQIGHRSPPAKAVRPFFKGWIGVSCHSAGDLASAARAHADYAVLSPVFGVPEKGPPLGTARFRQLVADAGLAVVALGGLDASNAGSLRSAGATGVAVIRALRDAEDPGAEARQLFEAVTNP